MVRAWLLSEEKGLTSKYITLAELYKTSGVEYYQIDPNNYEQDPLLKNLIEERDNHQANVVEKLEDDELLANITEHFHEHDEFRLVLEGCGFFDIRDKYDEWLRIELIPGDLIAIPGGCYHRFVVEDKIEAVIILLDGLSKSDKLLTKFVTSCVQRKNAEKNTYKGVRFLKDYGYRAFKRPNDELDCRKDYMRRLYNGAYDDQAKFQQQK